MRVQFITVTVLIGLCLVGNTMSSAENPQPDKLMDTGILGGIETVTKEDLAEMH